MNIQPWPEVVAVLPPLSTEEKARLKASIELQGVRVPILVLPDGRIIDGHHRWELSGGKAPSEVVGLSDEDALVLAQSLNLDRRHLTPEQIHALREKQKAIALKKREEGASQEEAALAAGVSDSTVSRWEGEPEDENNSQAGNTFKRDKRQKVTKPKRKEINEAVEGGQTLTQVAADFGITPQRAGQIVRQEAKRNVRETSPNIAPSGSRGPTPDIRVGRAENLDFLENESIDLIITSPPYNLGSEHWPMGGEGRQERKAGIGYQDGLSEPSYQAWQLAVLQELFRVSKSGASLFYNHKVRQSNGQMIHPMDWLRNPHNPWRVRQEIIWNRQSTHNHCSVLFWPHDERIYWMTKGKPALPDRTIGMSTVWDFFGPIPNTWHPAPFPSDLPKKCIEAIGQPGLTILDPFGGSMVTCSVAQSLGFEAIGVDINPDYVKQAMEVNGWTKPSAA